MRAVKSEKPGAKYLGPALVALLLLVPACTPQPGTGQPGTDSAPATSPVPSAPSAEAAPSTPAAIPGDTDEIGPPQTGDKVISTKMVLDWSWPGPGRAFKVAHEDLVPVSPPPAAPLPTLYAIGAGQHASENPPYDQLSFRFEGGFPGYELEFVPQLLADGSGLPVSLPGAGATLKVVFRGAQAHTADGTASTVTSAPPPAIGYKALAGYAPAGDVEGVLSYGIGVGRSMASVPETRVRVYEVEKIDRGRHLYVVAVQLSSAEWK